MSQTDQKIQQAHTLRDHLKKLLIQEAPIQSDTLAWGVWPEIGEMRRAVCKLYTELSGLSPGPSISLKENLYNWLTDKAFLIPDGHAGLIIAEECFGGVPGDGVNIHYHLILPDDIHIHFYYGTDYTQGKMEVEVRGSTQAKNRRFLQKTLAYLKKLRKAYE